MKQPSLITLSIFILHMTIGKKYVYSTTLYLVKVKANVESLNHASWKKRGLELRPSRVSRLGDDWFTKIKIYKGSISSSKKTYSVLF